MHTEADDASRELIHDDEYPVALQKSGFAPKQVNTPEAILDGPLGPGFPFLPDEYSSRYFRFLSIL